MLWNFMARSIRTGQHMLSLEGGVFQIFYLDTKASFQVKSYGEAQYYMQIQIEHVCFREVSQLPLFTNRGARGRVTEGRN